MKRLTDQIGSIRGVYLAGNRLPTRLMDFAPDKELVLLLHGFFQTRNLWRVMEARLRAEGYAVMPFAHRGLMGRFNTRPVDEVAQEVGHKVRRLARRHGFSALRVVGHSKGGLVARAWIQRHGGDEYATSLTTLGTPHHGTPTAALAVAFMGLGLARASARDMMPRSPFVRGLNAEPFPDGIPLTSIYSTADLICPPWSARLGSRFGGARNVVLPAIGHSALAWNEVVYRELKGSWATTSS